MFLFGNFTLKKTNESVENSVKAETIDEAGVVHDLYFSEVLLSNIEYIELKISWGHYKELIASSSV